ncbi:MAG: hypothetical protein HRU41_40110 [Saprospiraceae bacterium]|nr:hypothetical protein [Saprospiraceae bacterium]
MGPVFICGYTEGELESGQAKGLVDACLAKYVDDLTTTQHHLLVMKRFNQLSKEIEGLKNDLYSQNNDHFLNGLS